MILIIGGAIGSSSSSSSAISPGMRAVIVPTADAPRTVIIPPCGTGASVATANPTIGTTTAGVVTFGFPRGQGTRIVLVPKCTAVRGGVAAANYVPSAAFVTQPGTGPPPIGSARSTSSSSSVAGSPESAQFQVSVPVGSPVRTIVVAPCQRSRGSGPAELVLGPAAGSTTTAVAPSC